MTCGKVVCRPTLCVTFRAVRAVHSEEFVWISRRYSLIQPWGMCVCVLHTVSGLKWLNPFLWTLEHEFDQIQSYYRGVFTKWILLNDYFSACNQRYCDHVLYLHQLICIEMKCFTETLIKWMLSYHLFIYIKKVGHKIKGILISSALTSNLCHSLIQLWFEFFFFTCICRPLLTYERIAFPQVHYVSCFVSDWMFYAADGFRFVNKEVFF